MSNSDVPPENDSTENDLESPVDGPTPDWMKMATSASSGPALSEEDAPDWLKDIKSGKGTGPLKEPAAAEEEDAYAGMSDLERLLAEEGIDLGTVAEERPEGSEGMSAREFLISTSDDELVRKKVGAEPMAEQPAAPVTQDIGKPSPTPTAEEEDPYAGMSDLERLLAEEGIDLGAVAEERPEGSEGMSTREFLISTSDDEMIRKKVGAEPITEESPGPPPQPVQDSPPTPAPGTIDLDDDKMVVEDDLPDWLTEDTEEPPIPAGEPEPAASAQAMMTMGAADDDDDKMVVEDDLPDWLQDVEDETPPAPEPVSASAEPEDDDLPDWLSEETQDALSPVAEPEPAASAQPMVAMGTADDDDKMVVEDDLPDWLQDVEDEDSPAPEPIPTTFASDDDMMVADDDLPDWLSAEADEKFDEDQGDEDLPDWLSDIEEEDTEEELPPQPETASAPAAPIINENDIDIEEDDLPDWLKDVQEDDEPVPEPISSPVTDEVAASLDTDDSLTSDDDLPDWLQDVQEDDDASAPLLEADSLSTDDMVDEDDLPDWLSDIQSDDSDEPFEPSEPSPLEIEEEADEDLPDWLQEVKDETLEPDPGSEDVSIPAAEPVSATMVEADGSGDDKELPDWLQDMEDGAGSLGDEDVLPIPEAPSTQPAPVAATKEKIEEPMASQATPTPKPSTGGSGDMPDWLKKLRESDDEEVAAPQSTAPAPTPSPAPPQPVSTTVAAPPPEPSPVVEAKDEDKLSADVEERLKLAQSAREKGDIEEAVRYYDSLVSSGAYLDTIIEDMQQAIKSYPSNYMLFQVMGDAMMKDGRLQSALNAYREALEKLPG